MLNIREGYRVWLDERKREAGFEVSFGHWWTLDGNPKSSPYWRVSWIAKTGDLYATDFQDRYILLGTFPTRKEVNAVMQGWADPRSRIYRNLQALAILAGQDNQA